MKLFNYSNNYSTTINNVNTLVKVEQLTSFDMIYVYHLLSIGSKLNLYKEGEKLNGDLVYKVMFNSFKLGYVNIGSFSKIIFRDEDELEAIISNLAKEKYLPLNNLELSVKKKDLKMVS
tara:strand:- start:314 stop:670 length:357 start_codon:yes stop_codon:yes gene_type:complete